jgi:hypothetical protein
MVKSLGPIKGIVFVSKTHKRKRGKRFNASSQFSPVLVRAPSLPEFGPISRKESVSRAPGGAGWATDAWWGLLGVSLDKALWTAKALQRREGILLMYQFMMAGNVGFKQAAESVVSLLPAWVEAYRQVLPQSARW